MLPDVGMVNMYPECLCMMPENVNRVVEHGMVPLLVPEVFPPVDFSMQAHVFFGDTWHHPYISTCFCGKRFYFPCFFTFYGVQAAL